MDLDKLKAFSLPLPPPASNRARLPVEESVDEDRAVGTCAVPLLRKWVWGVVDIGAAGHRTVRLAISSRCL